MRKGMERFLAESRFTRNFNSTHLLFIDRVEEHTTDLKNVDVYFTRTYDATIIDNKEQSFLAVYGKFNRFIFWSVLKPFGGEENLGDLRIDPIRGEFKIPQKMDYYPMNSFFGNRIKGISQHALPSEEQQEKIFNEIMKDKDKFWQSDVGQAIYNDHYNLNKK